MGENLVIEFYSDILMKHLHSHDKGIDNFYLMKQTTLNVYFSNKKGQVYRVSHTLPSCGDGGFKSYKDMKRYWKNAYGYRLPESDEDLLYYQINFKLIGRKLFT